jgi:hypothetical protein
MHQADHFLSSFHFGFDLERLYLRFDPLKPLKEADLQSIKIKIGFMEPLGCELQLSWEPLAPTEKTAGGLRFKAVFLDAGGETHALKECAASKIVELALPFDLLALPPGTPFEFLIQVLQKGLLTESWPYQSSVKTARPTEDFGADFWSV